MRVYDGWDIKLPNGHIVHFKKEPLEVEIQQNTVCIPAIEDRIQLAIDDLLRLNAEFNVSNIKIADLTVMQDGNKDI